MKPKGSVVVVLPAVERYDGTGGAVATWVKETYSRVGVDHLIVSPAVSEEFRGDTSAMTPAWYRSWDRGTLRVAQALGSVMRRSPFGIYKRLQFDDRIWIRAAAAQARNADVVHVHNRPRYVKKLRERGVRARIILHMHNDLSAYITQQELSEIVGDVEKILFCSDFLRRKAQQDFETLPPTGVIYNGVTPPLTTDRADRESGPLRLVYAGRIVPEKGVLQAIEVCEALIAKGVPAQLRIAGGTGSGTINELTSYAADVRRAADELNASEGVGTVTLLGPIPHAQVFQEFENADVFVYPCLWEEPFGMVVLEAMAHGAIPVVTRSGGLPEVVGEAGLLVDLPVEPSRFAEAIRELIDETGHESYAAASLSRARNFAWERIADVMRSELVEAIKN